MRILKLEVTNFASYPLLSLDFTKESDLTLIYGATGSGKSTFLDAISWCCFGRTAKAGNADDIRPFNNQHTTTGVIWIQNSQAEIKINRSRGKSNDLVFMDEVRGKDLTETQKLIDEALGCDFETFITASYFHEFSPVGDFFKAKAKDRRDLFEQLAPLEFPKTLAEIFTYNKKDIKNQYEQANAKYLRLTGRSESLNKSYTNALSARSRFDAMAIGKAAKLREEIASYESKKAAQVKEIKEAIAKAEMILAKGITAAGVCGECGQHTNLEEVHKNKVAQQNYASHIKLLDQINNSLAPRLEADEPNPFTSQIEGIQDDIKAVESELAEHKTSLDALLSDLRDFSYLYDLTSTLRSKLLRSTVKTIESKCNYFLTKYFEGEFKVGLIVNDNDDLDVRLKKSGYDCNYKQLSKGQRQLLKLTFSLAVMEAASSKAGIHFQQLFLDEALDGLDVDMKLKAFSLLQDVAKDHSVYVIDHTPEFQSQFTTKYKVTMTGEESSINEV